MDTIVVEDLFFSYPECPVLQSISFSAPQGEFIGIIGPNGGGKTTLLSLLMGFLKPQKGLISILGKSPAESRQKMGWVPQIFHFDKQFPISVLEVVLTGRLQNASWYGKYGKEDKKYALEALEKVGMLSYQKARFADLSGGQAQRVLIARAIANHPPILLLDEPTASIDAQAQLAIYDILEELKGSVTILMVTHDLKAISAHVERVFCVQGELSILSKDTVCNHFTLGVYHSPLSGRL